MGVEAGTIGSIYVRQADGNYVKIDEFKNIEYITIDRDDGPREYVRIFKPNETMTFSASIDFGSRRETNRRM